MNRIRVNGGGPAACATILALRRLGSEATLGFLEKEQQTPPPLVLDEGTVALLINLWGTSSLFAGAHQLRRRVVCWGSDAPRVRYHPCLSISGAMLRRDLLNKVSRMLGGKSSAEHIPCDARHPIAAETDWSVFSEANIVPESAIRRYGRRVTLSGEVELCRNADPTVSWIEANAQGWIFLAPLSEDRAILQVTLPTAPEDPAGALSEILDRSFHISRFVMPGSTSLGVIPSAPALRRPCGGPGWLTVGSAAFTFDPLCGDGTGQSLRSGLLAAGVIAASFESGNRDALLRHFNDRIAIAFAAHLSACARFYSPSIFGESWLDEIEMTQTAAKEMAIYNACSLHFKLHDLRLVPSVNIPLRRS